MVLNALLHHIKTNNLSSKKESGSYKNYYKKIYNENCFLVKVLARSENSKKSLRQKISDFPYYDRPSSQIMPAVSLF